MQIKKALEQRIVDFLRRREGRVARYEISHATPHVTHKDREEALSKLSTQKVIKVFNVTFLGSNGVNYIKKMIELTL